MGRLEPSSGKPADESRTLMDRQTWTKNRPCIVKGPNPTNRCGDLSVDRTPPRVILYFTSYRPKRGSVYGSQSPAFRPRDSHTPARYVRVYNTARLAALRHIAL